MPSLPIMRWAVRGGGWTSKTHLACEQGRTVLTTVVTAGHGGHSPQFTTVLDRIRVTRCGPGRSRTRPQQALADRAYTSKANRATIRTARSRDSRGYGFVPAVSILPKRGGPPSPTHSTRGWPLPSRPTASHRRSRRWPTPSPSTIRPQRAVVTAWIAQTQADRTRAEAELRTTPRRMSQGEITALVTALGDITTVLRDADPADKAEVCG